MGEGRGEKRKALSLLRFHLSSFPPETPDTQASTVCSLQSAWSPFQHDRNDAVSKRNEAVSKLRSHAHRKKAG